MASPPSKSGGGAFVGSTCRATEAFSIRLVIAYCVLWTTLVRYPVPTSPQQSKAPTARRGRLNLEPRRCLNDHQPFQPKIRKQKFCSDACRKEFHRYGSSYGPLKTGLEKVIRDQFDRLKGDMDGLVSKQEKRQMEIEIKTLRFNMNGLTERMSELEGSLRDVRNELRDLRRRP